MKFLKSFMNKIAAHRAGDIKNQRENLLLREKNRFLHKKLELRLKELQGQLRIIQRLQKHEQTDEKLELVKEIAKVKAELQQVHIKFHLNSEEDFNHYYRHIRFTRPFVLIFNLALWFLLFQFGGVSTGFKTVIFIFALITTSGSIFELFFMMSIKDRILKPVESLKKGVLEISGGNYDVMISEETTNEITSLTKAFNEMAKKLKESEKLKLEYEENRKALIANISHDLKTPMTSVQGYIEAVMGNPEIAREKMENYLKIIHSNTAYMNRLIDDLFLFSKLDMQKLDFHFEEVQVRPFIEDMMEEFNLELREKGVAFDFRNDLNYDFRVKIDAKRFHQIVRNIVDNAVKHGPEENPEIKARLYDAEGFVCLDMADNGPGIPKDNLDHIFERFYRIESGRTKDLASTGLGLAIAKELTAAHSGRISVSSAVNQGSVFTVSLPTVK